METNHEYTNRLIHSGSPYLLQHAHNPVDWYEWGEVAWETARKANKPVVVSIGYSACHWCHVMERECFEDVQTAELMNRWFVNIKVDREERPDVDMVYMDACQLMTGRGGWPLNVICLPDQRPIFAGTYFPQESWQQVLLQIQALWANDKEKALDYAEKLQKGLHEMNLVEPAKTQKVTRQEMMGMYETLSKQFDYDEGGMNRAPKFPMPNNYEFLLDHYLCSGDRDCLDFVNLTLLKMANGGIYDQLRGGFCRYSTDKLWFAPHFEKMLYDNAQLIALYARAFAVTNAPMYKEIVGDTIAFCNRELRSADGGYFSALDADSEGIEGKYYVFTNNELKEALNEEEYSFALIAFSCKETGNWEHGYNILYKALAPLQVLEKTGLDARNYLRLLQSVKDKLLAVQNTRKRPGLDNKILAAWNGLMLEGLAKAAMYCSNEMWLTQARELATWMWETLQKDGKLWRVKTNVTTIPAFAEDYACFIAGLIALYEADANPHWLEKAEVLTNTLVKQFYDREKNIFWFTDKDGEQLILQKPDLSDDVISSANSMLSQSLQKLGFWLEREELISIGQNLLPCVKQQTIQYPGWYSHWARAAQAEAIGLLQVECTGPNALENMAVLKPHLPSWATTGAAANESSLPAFQNKFQPGKNLIYICQGQTCHEPVDNVEHALEIIKDLIGMEG